MTFSEMFYTAMKLSGMGAGCPKRSYGSVWVGRESWALPYFMMVEADGGELSISGWSIDKDHWPDLADVYEFYTVLAQDDYAARDWIIFVENNKKEYKRIATMQDMESFIHKQEGSNK